MIWLVTDNTATRDALTPLIQRHGYEVAAVDCSDEVQKRLQFHTPSMLIIDCDLPDGFELTAAARKHPRSRHVPIVMFTASCEDVRRRALLAGADACVSKKSLDWAELLTEIHRYAKPRTDERN